MSRSGQPPQHGRAPSPFIPLSFVAIALVTLGATIVSIIVWQPPALAIIHALAVGVFLTVALGLLYQFIPVVTMSTLRWPHLAYVHLVLAACGTASIVVGFSQGSFSLVYLGGGLHAAGLLIEGTVLAGTVYGHVPPAAAGSALLSFGWLGATIALGIVMASRLSGGTEPVELVGVHAIAGLAGFFGTLIIGVSLRLLRMFERVDRESNIVIANASAHAGAIAALAGGIWRSALVPALIPFFVIARIVFARNPAYQRETLWYTSCSALGALTAAAAAAIGADRIAATCALWFFVGTAEVGYLQRIIPFIWWIRRARREGAREIPTLAEMNDSRLGALVLVLWLGAGLCFATQLWVRVGAALGLLAWLGLLAQLLRPFVLNKRLRES